jgi:hypothetical protein
MRTIAIAAIAAGLSFVGATAQAASTASATATLSNLQIRLIDLNPGDGIAPSITFLPPTFPAATNSGDVAARFSTPFATQSTADRFFSNLSPWQPGNTQAASSFSSASASLAGLGTPNGTTYSASGEATSPGDVFVSPDMFIFTAPFATFDADVLGPTTFGGGFTLTPFTIALISGDVSLQVAAIGGGINNTGFTFRTGNSASTFARMSVRGPAAGGGDGEQTSGDSRSLDAQAFFDSGSSAWVNDIRNAAGPIGVTFSNATNSSMNGLLSISVGAAGGANGNLSPIPEPTTWALLLAGLAVVGRAVARRR